MLFKFSICFIRVSIPYRYIAILTRICVICYSIPSLLSKFRL
nr:MAG TPA: hypothetical protein [Caudoviricetes sp.]